MGANVILSKPTAARRSFCLRVAAHFALHESGELVALQPDLILTQNTVSTASIFQETRSIPIIFANVADPIGSAEVTSLAGRYALPAVYPYSDYTKVGGLVSYGYDLVDNYRRAAIYADRILRGTKPSELPVRLPVKVQLTINLKTAKALGLDVPSSIRLRADEVIE
jgi:putative tryptophan/tyrosine transport system substrate-binding protein